jgi:hypothetical protein
MECSNIEWWEIQKLGNQWEGQASERSDLWGCHTILTGVSSIGLGLCCLGLGLHEQYVASQPVIPRICSSESNPNPAKSKFDRYIQVGCTAAQKKEYQIALTNFSQALAIRNREIISMPKNDSLADYVTKTMSKQSDIDSVKKAIEQMKDKLK